MKSVMIVDRDQNFLERVQSTLKQKQVKVQGFRDYGVAKTEIARSKPDMVILDVNDSSALGWKILFSACQMGSPRVIVTSESLDEASELLALRTGAEDVIRKTKSSDIIAERVMIRLSSQGHESDSEDKIVVEGSQGKLVIDMSRHETRWRDDLIDLTHTEINILRALAEHPGIVKSRAQLLDEVWQEGVYVVDRSIDSHIKRIRRKIHAHDPNFSGIETIYGFGYKLNLSLPDEPRAYLRNNSTALFSKAGLDGRIAKDFERQTA